MNKGSIIAASLLAVVSAGPALALEERVTNERVVNEGELDRVVRVENVRMTDDGRVSGVVRNDSDRRLSDVHVRVTYDWLWKNERHPGGDSPAFSEDFVLRGDVPPHGTRPFDFTPRGGLPSRNDGRFVARVDVDQLVQFPVASSGTGTMDRGDSYRGSGEYRDRREYPADTGSSPNDSDRYPTQDRYPSGGSDRYDRPDDAGY